MAHQYTEYEFTRRDGSKVYDIAASAADAHELKRMHDAVSMRPIGNCKM
jgi:hypothetical protein